MCTRSNLVPEPKTTVIGLGVRLVHKLNHKLASRQYAQLAQSFPVVVDKAYEHHIGKVLYSTAYLQLNHKIAYSQL